MRRFFFSGAIVGSLFNASCTCGREKVSFETAEEARKIARDNSGFIARTFRADAKFEDYDLLLRGDSTITVECPQGDGWASVDLRHKQSGEVIKLKCSTVSEGIGCLTETDFKQRAQYANKEGRCDDDLPHPLPKIAN